MTPWRPTTDRMRSAQPISVLLVHPLRKTCLEEPGGGSPPATCTREFCPSSARGGWKTTGFGLPCWPHTTSQSHGTVNWRAGVLSRGSKPAQNYSRLPLAIHRRQVIRETYTSICHGSFTPPFHLLSGVGIFIRELGAIARKPQKTPNRADLVWDPGFSGQLRMTILHRAR